MDVALTMSSTRALVFRGIVGAALPLSILAAPSCSCGSTTRDALDSDGSLGGSDTGGSGGTEASSESGGASGTGGQDSGSDDAGSNDADAACSFDAYWFAVRTCCNGHECQGDCQDGRCTCGGVDGGCDPDSGLDICCSWKGPACDFFGTCTGTL
jgi:hypothetical protein